MAEVIIGEKFISLLVLFGILPVERKKVFRIRKNLIIYCAAISVFIFSTQYFMFLLFKLFRSRSLFMYIATCLNTFGYSLTCFFSVVIIQFRAQRICSILNDIAHCWGRLGATILSSYKNSSIRLFFRWNFLALECLLLVYVAYSIFFRRADSYVISSIMSLIINHYLLCCDQCFMVTTLNICLLLRYLNKSFNEICGRTSLRWAEYKLTDRGDVSTIRYFSNEYSNIHDIVKVINECFSPINLFGFAFSSSGTMFTVFVFLTRFDTRGDDVFLTRFEVFYFVYFFMNKSLFSIFVAKKVIQEADYSTELLHALYIECDDQRVLEEVEILSLQLAHRKIEFDACGLFKLDFSLLLKMIGTMITYGIILLQFEYR